MSKTITDQTLALAGIFQAVLQVQRVARQGRVENEPFEASLKSILVTDTKTTEEVFGGIASIQEGLRALLNNLGGDEKQRDMEQTRYAITLLHLERKLAARRDMLDAIARRIENAHRQLDHFPLTHDNVIAGLADIYSNTISTLTPRIMVNGEHGHLNQPENANKVRALLLAGMRAAVLWRQSGGGRLKLLFKRKRYLEDAQRLLRAGTAETTD